MEADSPVNLPWDFTVLSDASGWAVLALVVLWILRLVAKRKWVPEATLRDEQADTQEWRDIALDSLETNRKIASLMEEVRVVLDANTAYLRALPSAPEEGPSDGQ